jgi:hypothetical protein
MGEVSLKTGIILTSALCFCPIYVCYRLPTHYDQAHCFDRYVDGVRA